jgi:UTP---glucose-1-phosphate uridylyltransferase
MTEETSVEYQLQRLFALKEALRKCATDRERIEVLDKEPCVLHWLGKPSWLRTFSALSSPECELIIKSLVAIGQDGNLIAPKGEFSALSEKLRTLLEDLFPVEAFYKDIGGIVGYHWTMFSILCSDPTLTIALADVSYAYHRPPGIDISCQNEEVSTYILEGLVSLPLLAEIYPVGGAADRLKLCDPKSGTPLPAAKLQFCGHTLLEGLVRDVQAKEHLYYKLFSEQVVTPIAMMTSSEKDNHRHILELCQEKCWFGRPRESFSIFCQPVVPTMDRNGKWCLSGNLKFLMKPGGHGAIWKVAKEEGILDWLEKQGRTKILIRQINNPIAGIDYGTLAFCGVGFREGKVFGFASCSRQIRSAEGVNILIEKKWAGQSRYCLTNIEYCDFSKFSIEDAPVEPESPYSQFPSNTNILFADISTVKQTVARCPIPGMLVNLKQMSFIDEEGIVREQEVARLESTMQNLADCFEKVADPSFKKISLETYLTYNHRRKTISTTKKLFQGGDSLLETPEGCFYDILCNAHDLLKNYCRICVPDVPSTRSYIDQGPSFLFSYHPALGPLFSIIAQKVRGGIFNLYSELKLEIAEVDIENLNLSGSLQIIAERITGELQADGTLKYSERTGSVRMRNVTVANRGFDSDAPNVYWKAEIAHLEKCEIFIRGDGEFVAEDIALCGDLKIEVDDGFRVIAFEEAGKLKFKKEPLSIPSKKWIYYLNDDGSISLTHLTHLGGHLD